MKRIGNGPGWGGPAKGAGSSTKDRRRPAGEPGPGGGHKNPARAAIEAKKLADAERYKRVISEIALDPEVRPETRVIAADKMLDRIEGKPVQRNQNENSGPGGAPMTVVVDDRRSISDYLAEAIKGGSS